jgi:hypothetical protein
MLYLDSSLQDVIVSIKRRRKRKGMIRYLLPRRSKESYKLSYTSMEGFEANV